MSNSLTVTWKLIIEYSYGYRVEDEKGNTILNEENSFHAIRKAKELATTKNINVTFEWFAETETGLEKTNPPLWFSN